MRLKGIAMSLLSVCVFTPATSFAESQTVNTPEKEQVQTGICVLTGRIIDSETGEGIPMATINVPGTLIGTACDAGGRFRIELIEGKSYNLLVRSTGYMEQTIKFNANGAQKEMDIQMNAGIFDLNEVVVTGTRTEKTISNTPVLTRLIPAAQLQRNDFENIMDALEFTIPGLQFNSDPRGDNIRIQGLENKYVLILVDGERLSNTPGGPIDFERLSTSNIKQIEIIKGAASALYGSSAIGMIVNIITKTPERLAEGWVKARYSRFNELLLDGSFGTAYKDFTSQTLFNRNSTDGYDLTPETPEAFTKQPSSNRTFDEKLGWTH
ncbi:TonB-dependent receptor, partial [Parabacteroides faecis]|uniref:TonB-dependent receptor n=1 Tax=Parabacteroides faecis TaxID=1217282 RepID=UPI003A92EC15